MYKIKIVESDYYNNNDRPYEIWQLLDETSVKAFDVKFMPIMRGMSGHGIECEIYKENAKKLKISANVGVIEDEFKKLRLKLKSEAQCNFVEA